ncbi:hypothetical protein EBQ25_00830 [Allofranklinella schreckenbergeri]|uniref:Lipoprotein n=1 Tax=Allofranklinella schreckenbergeri TaxID=1076744 RepID=A0A3M6QK10_9BURK|nr:hypothetical protein [Allofranklinella schreckenbergeri]RMX02802.1 hypothetical protein EBQ25_00830 [Allofranklinella schreckenbergeri]
MHSRFFATTALTALLAACGGGGDSPLPPEPPTNLNPPPAQPEPAKPLPKPVPNALTVMAGSANFADKACANSPRVPLPEEPVGWNAVRFHSVERLYSSDGNLYFITDGGVEQCAQLPHPISLAHRMDANGLVHAFMLDRMPDTGNRYPSNRISGFFFQGREVYGITIGQTNADKGYALADGYGKRYFDYQLHGPLLLQFPRSAKNPLNPAPPLHYPRITGLPNSQNASPPLADDALIPFDAIDGPPGQARFYAPHSLVTGGDGVQYFVDKGQVRSIDGHLHVRTLTLPSMAEGDVALDLDVDAQGQVHLISQNAAGAYAWHQLASGQRRDFRIEGYGLPHISMAVRAGAQGQTLALAVRDDALPEKWSSVYRVDWAANPAGAATGSAPPRLLLGGAELPATAQDYLQAPSRYRLPNVRDVHFVGQTLWLSVAQAVLAMELE